MISFHCDVITIKTRQKSSWHVKSSYENETFFLTVVLDVLQLKFHLGMEFKVLYYIWFIGNFIAELWKLQKSSNLCKVFQKHTVVFVYSNCQKYDIVESWEEIRKGNITAHWPKKLIQSTKQNTKCSLLKA